MHVILRTFIVRHSWPLVSKVTYRVSITSRRRVVLYRRYQLWPALTTAVHVSLLLERVCDRT